MTCIHCGDSTEQRVIARDGRAGLFCTLFVFAWACPTTHSDGDEHAQPAAAARSDALDKQPELNMNQGPPSANEPEHGEIDLAGH